MLYLLDVLILVWTNYFAIFILHTDSNILRKYLVAAAWIYGIVFFIPACLLLNNGLIIIFYCIVVSYIYYGLMWLFFKYNLKTSFIQAIQVSFVVILYVLFKELKL